MLRFPVRDESAVEPCLWCWKLIIARLHTCMRKKNIDPSGIPARAGLSFSPVYISLTTSFFTQFIHRTSSDIYEILSPYG